MLTDRAASPPAWTRANRVQACRSGESAIAAETLMNIAGWENSSCGEWEVDQSVGTCRTLTVLLWRLIYGHLRRFRLEKFLNVFQRMRLGYSRPAAAQLTVSPSPRDEGKVGQAPRGKRI
jgi:hypothetical protein